MFAVTIITTCIHICLIKLSWHLKNSHQQKNSKKNAIIFMLFANGKLNQSLQSFIVKSIALSNFHLLVSMFNGSIISWALKLIRWIKFAMKFKRRKLSAIFFSSINKRIFNKAFREDMGTILSKKLIFLWHIKSLKYKSI